MKIEPQALWADSLQAHRKIQRVASFTGSTLKVISLVTPLERELFRPLKEVKIFRVIDLTLEISDFVSKKRNFSDSLFKISGLYFYSKDVLQAIETFFPRLRLVPACEVFITPLMALRDFYALYKSCQEIVHFKREQALLGRVKVYSKEEYDNKLRGLQYDASKKALRAFETTLWLSITIATIVNPGLLWISPLYKTAVCIQFIASASSLIPTPADAENEKAPRPNGDEDPSEVIQPLIPKKEDLVGEKLEGPPVQEDLRLSHVSNLAKALGMKRLREEVLGFRNPPPSK